MPDSVKPGQVPNCLLLSSPIVLVIVLLSISARARAQEQERKSKGQYPVHRGVRAHHI